MRIRLSVGGALLAVATTLAAALGATGPAAAAMTPSGGKPAAALAPPPTDGCYASGTRIKSPSSSKVYLVDPQGYWDWIPTETDYNNLFGSWSGLVVTSDFSCFSDGGALSGAKLVKTSGSPKVYIYDGTYGYYRWIPTETAFNKYHFDWSKIRTQSTISPIMDLNWT